MSPVRSILALPSPTPLQSPTPTIIPESGSTATDMKRLKALLFALKVHLPLILRNEWIS